MSALWKGGGKATRQRYYSTERGRLLSWLDSLKYYAKKRGHEWKLNPDELTIPSVCPVLGMPLERGSVRYQDNSISLDRKDNSKGYTPDNVSVISSRANRLKGDAKFWEVCALAKYMAPKITIENLRVREER
jgi:hypothetical protein